MDAKTKLSRNSGYLNNVTNFEIKRKSSEYVDMSKFRYSNSYKSSDIMIPMTHSQYLQPPVKSKQVTEDSSPQQDQKDITITVH